MKASKSQKPQMHPQLRKLDQKLKKASQMYEEQFLRQMVKAMRSSVSHSKLTKPSMGENIYRQQLDEKTVDTWVKRGGVGFGDMIYNDLVEKFYPMLGDRKVKNVRPANLSDRFQGVSRSLTSKAQGKHTFNLNMAAQKAAGKSYLQLPWQGTLEKQFEMPDGQKVAMFSHPFGLKSTFVFQGQVEPGLLNKTLSEGENFAQLGPESQSLTWQIEDANSRKASSVGENRVLIKE